MDDSKTRIWRISHGIFTLKDLPNWKPPYPIVLSHDLKDEEPCGPNAITGWQFLCGNIRLDEVPCLRTEIESEMCSKDGGMTIKSFMEAYDRVLPLRGEIGWIRAGSAPAMLLIALLATAGQALLMTFPENGVGHACCMSIRDGRLYRDGYPTTLDALINNLYASQGCYLFFDIFGELEDLWRRLLMK